MAAAPDKVTHLRDHGQATDYNPANGEIVGVVDNTDMTQFPAMVEKARSAQTQWSTLSYEERGKYLLKMRRYVIDNADELARVISSSNGKTRVDAMVSEVMTAASACNWYAKNAAKVLKPKSRAMGSILFFNKRTRIEYMPLGVVGIIAPWNYPMAIPFHELLMGLMAGNAVILKVADATSQVGVIINDIVSSAGLPDGLFQMVYARGSVVSSAMLENGINKLFFTGGVSTGKTIMAAAAQTLTPVSLELGGNDPALVLNDADVERTSNGIIWAGFQNAGQSCGGAERVYVQEGIYDEFMDALCKKVNALRHGVPTDEHSVDIGSMTTDKQRDAVVEHVEDAVAKGARIVAESKAVGDTDKGFFHPAMVLADCTHDMETMKDETFGPIVAVTKFKTIDEAVKLANQSNLALSASVWTKDVKKGRRIASLIEAGVVAVNDHLYTHGMAENPWGGWKESGMGGRTHGHEGLKEMVNEKAVNWDWVNANSNLWWHPHDKQSYNALKNALQFAFPNSLISWLTHTTKLSIFLIKKSFGKWKV